MKPIITLLQYFTIQDFETFDSKLGTLEKAHLGRAEWRLRTQLGLKLCFIQSALLRQKKKNERKLESKPHIQCLSIHIHTLVYAMLVGPQEQVKWSRISFLGIDEETRRLMKPQKESRHRILTQKTLI